MVQSNTIKNTNNITKKKRTRCPNGTRKDKKTGICVPTLTTKPNVEQPRRPISIQQPRQPISIEQPREPISIEQPREPISIEQPREPISIQQPREPISIEQPREPISIEQPREPISTEQPREPSVEQPREPISIEQPREPSVEQPRDPSVEIEDKQIDDNILTTMLTTARNIITPNRQEKAQDDEQNEREDDEQNEREDEPQDDEIRDDEQSGRDDDDNEETNIELLNRKMFEKNPDKYDYLYPHHDDPNFNNKISLKKEFNDTRYDGKIYDDLEEHADKLCNAEFELTPHQLFVRNFLSFQTPYNSLLLYHGLGTGKTCSAIGVAEEMRDYYTQMGITQRTIIVASPNVQENFKLQLFDRRKLESVDGLWNIKACTSNKFLKEINPMNMKGLSKENVSKQIERIIKNSYVFLGYIEFANYIRKKSEIDMVVKNEKKKNTFIKEKLKKIFNNRLIIIDEVHNIRITEDNENKRVAIELTNLIKNVDNLKLLLLSATPMYNNYKEIVWLINLMNMNDNRPEIQVNDIFNADGSFIIDDDGNEVGKELLERKATGYISYVRGDNPYTFPYRIWPSIFSPENSYEKNVKPNIQMNDMNIIQGLKFVEPYLSEIGSEQQKGYDYIISRIREDINKDDEKQISIGQDISLDEESIRNLEQDEIIENSSSEDPVLKEDKVAVLGGGSPNIENSTRGTFENMTRFNYTMLTRPIQGLNIIYPNENLDQEDSVVNLQNLVGSEGLRQVISFETSGTPMRRRNFKYKSEKYGRIFSPSEIGKYSGKIKAICKRILNSSGVVLIYSQYIDGGVIPIALALEELGFTRAEGMNSLFETPSTDKIDAITLKTKEDDKIPFNPAKYIMITGDKTVSPDNVKELKIATNEDNVDGKKVKVILISQAGSEGLDFKFIRQVHVLEPWWNMNRIEQIIGRAVRTCSHKALPFSKRNVEIYLHGTILKKTNIEAVDMYIYRLAELKALKIGQVSRLLKGISVDCLLNTEQQNFTQLKFDKSVTQQLSSNKITIEYDVGDKPFSAICDYMEKCEYQCRPNSKIRGFTNTDTYGEEFISVNNDKIIRRIKTLMKANFFYRKRDLIAEINVINEYPISQINSALNQLIEDKNEYITDKYDRLGNLINIEDLYLFQPLEINDSKISIFERSTPIDFKRNKISITSQKKSKKVDDVNKEQLISDEIISNLVSEFKNNYDLATDTNPIKRGTSNWYMLASVVVGELLNNNISSKDIDYALISHMLEEIDTDLTKNLLNYLQSKDNGLEELSDIEKLIKKYYNDNIIENDKIKCILLNNNGNKILLKLVNKKWVLGESEDYVKIEKELAVILNRIKNSKIYNKYIGFMTSFKKDNIIVFKIKDVTKKRDTGARCDQGQKLQTIKILDSIITEFNYNKNVNHKQLCMLLELILRVYNKNKKDNKVWFLSPTENLLFHK